MIERAALESKIQTANDELKYTKDELQTTKTKLNERITEAEVAVKPKPLPERLRALLQSIDSKIGVYNGVGPREPIDLAGISAIFAF